MRLYLAILLAFISFSGACAGPEAASKADCAEAAFRHSGLYQAAPRRYFEVMRVSPDPKPAEDFAILVGCHVLEIVSVTGSSCELDNRHQPSESEKESLREAIENCFKHRDSPCFG